MESKIEHLFKAGQYEIGIMRILALSNIEDQFSLWASSFLVKLAYIIRANSFFKE